MDKGKRQVRLRSAEGGADGPEDDGYSWRKYGQKDILGSDNPRLVSAHFTESSYFSRA
jgi:hypothetical protein